MRTVEEVTQEYKNTCETAFHHIYVAFAKCLQLNQEGAEIKNALAKTPEVLEADNTAPKDLQ